MATKTELCLDKENAIASTVMAIYRKYWLKPDLDELVYSSHWRKYASMNDVEIYETGNKLKCFIKTKGFGSYLKNSAFRRIIDTPRQIMLKRLLRGIDDENLLALS